VRREPLHDAILQRLGLEHDPFANNAGASFLNTSELQQRNALLLHLARTSTRPILVLGNQGGGKTRFLTSVSMALPTPFISVIWPARDDSTVEAFLSHITAGFGLELEPTSEGESAVDAVRSSLAKISASGAVATLLVDDADRLADPVLEQLLILGDTSEGYLRLVLAGGPGLDEQANRLRTPSGPHWLSLVDLPAFDEQQVADYLSLRLADAGWSGDSPFTDEICAQFCSRSRGNPDELNRVATEYLRAKFRRTKIATPTKRRFDPIVLVGAIGAVVVTTGAILSWLWSDAPPPGIDTSPIKGFKLPERSPPPVPNAVALTAPQSTPPTYTRSTPSVLPPPPSVPTGQVSAPRVPTPNVPSAPVEPPSTVENPPERVAQSASSAGSTYPRPRPPPRARRSSQPQATSAPATSAPTAPAPTPPARPTKATPMAVQLAAFKEMQAAIGFIASNGLARRAEVYLVEEQSGGNLFAVVLGTYPSRAAAVQAINTLPATLKTTQPWPRSLKGLRRISVPR
jgi:DamX protein